MDTTQSATMDAKKNSVESMTKEELLNKYKGLLGIAKQAKKAKDEFAEENQKLKDQLTNCETQREADKKSLLTMKEMLEEFTRNKLEMTSDITELRDKNRLLEGERTKARNEVDTLSIENEALRRQLTRLTDDNESLLTDIDQMEQQLQKVNVLGMEQKKHLDILELEVEKLKEYEVTSRKLETQLQDLMQANKSLQESYHVSQSESQNLSAKYQSLKEINSDQRAKFNGLKERFIEVYKKLKQLQECKRVLMESHHEYADSISRWQLEIMHASEQLCSHIQSLTKENTELKREVQVVDGDAGIALSRLPVLIEYCEKALVEYQRQNEVIDELRREKNELRALVENKAVNKENNALEISNFDEQLKLLRTENEALKEESTRAKISAEECQNAKIDRLRRENESLAKEISIIRASSDENTDLMRSENGRLEQESAKDKLTANEDIKLLRAENVRLEEAINIKLLDDEEICHLKEENFRLTQEASNATQSADELKHLNAANERSGEENTKMAEQLSNDELDKVAKERLAAFETINQLMAEKIKLEEEFARSQLSSGESVKQLMAEYAKLEEELANSKESADKMINVLRTENERVANEATKAAESQAMEVERLMQSNQCLRDELQAFSSTSRAADSVVVCHLPILIECCEKALLEHRQQVELIEELRKEKDNEKVEKKLDNDSLAALKSEHDRLKEELFDAQQHSAKVEASNSKAEFSEELETLRNENKRLREGLSKAQQQSTEVAEVLKLRDDLFSTTQLCEDLQTKLEKQERENTDLLNEMRELNEALKGRGDVISRQQAKHQELVSEIKKTTNALAKIEADLAAKDTIIKEKELRIAKMSEDNTSALHEVHRLQNISRENESRIKTLSDEISTIRAQMENHDTQSEVLSTSTISRAEELARLREVDESFEEKYNKLRSLAVKLKKKAHEQSLCIVDLEKQSADSKAKASETGERITSLENERESLQKDLKTCKNQIESLKTEVDKLKASKKQSNVLTLEIEAFEKSLNETSAKLTAKIAEYDLLRETLQSKDSAIEVMKKEIKILEESKESEKVHSVELKKQIDKLQAQLKDVIHAKQEVCAKLEETQAEKQSLQSDLDEVSQRLASISSERDAERVVLVKEKEGLLQTITTLEDELNASNSRITLAERSFQDLHLEYSNYKVKAQSVLRQNQTKESSKERELEEELALIKGEHKELSNRLQTYLDKMHASEKVIEGLQEENRLLTNRNSELANIITDIRHQTETLSRENKKQLETYQETLKGHRVQIEALDSCHKGQMQDLQAKYDRDIAELKAIHKKDSEVSLQKPLDYILMEREDAEGSEAETTNTPKYQSSARRSTHDMVPLDELLSSPTVDSSYTVLERRRSISPSVELQETKERLHKQESRVRHLTSLLAESEQDLARLTQLNEMLKEEVRRQERTVEREKHMHNSEYLKNVVLKFVSLNNGDERTRLVPVLNTILKLSPSETEMLQNVAKGKVADNNNRSWGSFLPHWGNS